MVMPYGTPLWGANLTQAVNNGSISESRLDDMATRVIANWYQMKQDTLIPKPGIGMPADLSVPHERVIGTNASFADVLFQGAVEGHVLVKNDNNALPLKNPKLLSIFGYSAKAPDAFNYGMPGWNDGSFSQAPGDATYVSGVGFLAVYNHTQTLTNGTFVSGGGSGANEPAYISSPFEALSLRARQDGTHLWWDFHSTNPKVDQGSDACIVVVNAWGGEGWDRPGLHDDYTDGLILNVAANCSNTIVVFQNVGVRLVDQFIDHPNVTALIYGHVPGQDSGAALASILYGDSNPSGKMPYSVPRNESDFGPLANATQPDGIYKLFPQSDFDEGVYIDYRALDAKNITPRFEFGFGLSYTTFDFANLAVSMSGASRDEYPSGPILEGGHKDLWDVVATVTADVKNTGDRAGAEVAQLYVGIPGAPVRQLRGFEKPVLQPGETAKVKFDLTRRDLSTWDVVAQKWQLQKGGYAVSVGSSSRDLPLTTTLTI